MATDEQIKNLAYTIWQQEDCPNGKDVEHYFRAKKILEEQESARIPELAPPSPQPGQIGPPKRSGKPSIHARNKKK